MKTLALIIDFELTGHERSFKGVIFIFSYSSIYMSVSQHRSKIIALPIPSVFD